MKRIVDCVLASLLLLVLSPILLVRYLSLWLRSNPNHEFSERVNLLGVSIDNRTMDEALKTIGAWLEGDGQRRICFVNAHCLNVAQHHPDYRACVNGADLVLADGIGLQWAGRCLRQPIVQNVNGTDLFPRLCQALQHSGKRIYLLGGQAGVAEAVRVWMEREYPGITVAGCHHGYLDPQEESALIHTIRQSYPDLLLVALGVPKQELWIENHLAETGVKVAIGVGGLFDFYSGRATRAPLWMRESGLEWMYRLLREPRRLWRRYLLGNTLFILRVIRERYKTHMKGNQDESA